MAYWKEWKSLIGGGIALLLIGVFMMILCTFPGASGGRSGLNLGIMDYGIVFIALGIIFVILGFLLRKKP
jgi:hypothetical protein